MPIKLILAEDETLIRKLFVSALAKYSDIEIVGQAANGEDTLKMIKEIHPDVLLLDLNMPGATGLDVLRQIRKESNPVNTLVISMQDNDAIVEKVISEGAMGFISKNDDWEEMHDGIITVAKGEFFHTKKINSILLRMARELQKRTLFPEKENEFNDRELSVIQYLHKGLSSAEISQKIYCSRSTVDRIRQELIHRVGARNTAELISHAVRNKLLEANK